MPPLWLKRACSSHGADSKCQQDMSVGGGECCGASQTPCTVVLGKGSSQLRLHQALQPVLQPLRWLQRFRY